MLGSSVAGLFRVGMLNSGMFSGVVRFGSISVERSEEPSVCLLRYLRAGGI